MTRKETFITFATLITCATLCSSAAVAGPNDGDSKWYAGINIGQASIDDVADALLLDDSATAYRIYGGFDFNRFFGVEVQYIDFGEVSGDAIINGTTISATAEANGFGLAGVARIPLAEQFNLTGRLGYLAWDADTQAAGLSAGNSDKDIFIGVGGEWIASDQWVLGLDLERYKLDDVDANVWSVGARFRF